jgi:hypothetical protein
MRLQNTFSSCEKAVPNSEKFLEGIRAEIQTRLGPGALVQFTMWQNVLLKRYSSCCYGIVQVDCVDT